MASKNQNGRIERPRRGRPAGRNRVPLSPKQRRARNKLYERERREELSKVMAELADALGLDRNTTQHDLLNSAVNCVQRKVKESDEIHALRKRNQKLKAQLEDCKNRLCKEWSMEELVGSLQNPDDSLVLPKEETISRDEIVDADPTKLYGQETITEDVTVEMDPLQLYGEEKINEDDTFETDPLNLYDEGTISEDETVEIDPLKLNGNNFHYNVKFEPTTMLSQVSIFAPVMAPCVPVNNGAGSSHALGNSEQPIMEAAFQPNTSYGIRGLEEYDMFRSVFARNGEEGPLVPDLDNMDIADYDWSLDLLDQPILSFT